MGCVKEFDDDSLEDQYPSCGYAFLLWATPGCVSLAFAVFALTTCVTSCALHPILLRTMLYANVNSLIRRLLILLH